MFGENRMMMQYTHVLGQVGREEQRTNGSRSQYSNALTRSYLASTASMYACKDITLRLLA